MERESLIYHLDSISCHSEDHEDLPDEFFEVTVDDVRKRFAQLKSERWGEERWWMDFGQTTVRDILYKYLVAAETRLDQMFLHCL